MSNNFNGYQTNNNANWESQMLYAERVRRQEIERMSSAETLEHKQSKQEKSKKPNNKTLKGLAKLAVVSSALAFGMDKFNEHIIDPGTTINDRISQIKADDSGLKRLDNEMLSQEDIDNRATEAPSTITLKKEGVIRSNDWTYAKANQSYFEARPDSPTHTSMLIAEEDLNFNITQGHALKTDSRNRIGLRIENFEKTADGKYTGLKMDADKDGWVFVDLPEDEE
ncbi:MAG: hypothetical protein Q4A21_02485 [bacterium]|nr:hypothetical protein [bacterium]